METIEKSDGRLGGVWRHKKRGSTYRVIGTAPLQSSNPIVEGCELVVYQSTKERTFHARPAEEFHDGRFELTKPEEKIDERHHGTALTREMIDAGVAVLRQHLEIEEPMDSGFDRDLCIDIWHAMRSARQNSAVMHDSSPAPGQVLR